MGEGYDGRKILPSYSHGPELEGLSLKFAKLLSSSTGVAEFGQYKRTRNIPLSPPHVPPYSHRHHRESTVITQQPFGSQDFNARRFNLTPIHCYPASMQLSVSPQLNTNFDLNAQGALGQHDGQQAQEEPSSTPLTSGGIRVTLPGLQFFNDLHFMKVADSGVFSGSYTCSPSYCILSESGDVLLRAVTSKLFCPFDARTKAIELKDATNACLFQIKFLPSICECDSEEKRCFAVYSPLYETPFGAILFEAGQIKYSLRVINALEGETFTVRFISSRDIALMGADGRILGIINIPRKTREKGKYNLTLTEDISSTNKALFLSCVITLDLVRCESACSRCVCVCPFIAGSLTVLGLTMLSK